MKKILLAGICGLFLLATCALKETEAQPKFAGAGSLIRVTV